jgi:predicted nucleotide-binding protein
MSALKPYVVIFSSKVELKTANKLANALAGVAECHVWREVMQVGGVISLELRRLLKAADFAICVLTGDQDSDRPGTYLSQNVVFEAGLCFGILGAERTFLFLHKDQSLDLADLGGIIYGQYENSEDLAEECIRIAKAINDPRRRISQPGVFLQTSGAFSSVVDRLSRGFDVDRVEMIQHSSAIA